MLLPIVTVPEVGFASKPAPQGRFSSAPVVGCVGGMCGVCGGMGASKLNSFADSNCDFVDMLTMLIVLIMLTLWIMFTKLVMLSKSFLIFFHFLFSRMEFHILLTLISSFLICGQI